MPEGRGAGAGFGFNARPGDVSVSLTLKVINTRESHEAFAPRGRGHRAAGTNKTFFFFSLLLLFLFPGCDSVDVETLLTALYVYGGGVGGGGEGGRNLCAFPNGSDR